MESHNLEEEHSLVVDILLVQVLDKDSAPDNFERTVKKMIGHSHAATRPMN